jgi:hypothetical protein
MLDRLMSKIKTLTWRAQLLLLPVSNNHCEDRLNPLCDCPRSGRESDCCIFKPILDPDRLIRLGQQTLGLHGISIAIGASESPNTTVDKAFVHLIYTPTTPSDEEAWFSVASPQGAVMHAEQERLKYVPQCVLYAITLPPA